MAIWKISEHKEELSELIGEHLHEHNSKHENLHWLASRALIKNLFPDHKVEVFKDEFNKPSLKIDGMPYHISITHSFQFAAVMVSKSKTVAIDMEKLDERIQRVKHKLMREDELDYLSSENETGMLVTVWAAKETLFKFYGKKELDFKLHLQIESFNYKSKFELTGLIRKNGFSQTLTINVEELDGYVLTFIA